MRYSKISESIENDKKREEIGKKHQNNIDFNFDKNIYNKGTEWALEGKNIEDAGVLATNKSFLNGFARGLRLIQIEQASKKSPLKR